MNKAAIIAISSAALLVCGCGSGTGESGNQAAEPAVKSLTVVEVQPAAKQLVTDESEYSTTVQANIVNNIAPQTSGRIVKINAEIGDFVSQGQILAEMEKVQLEQAEFKFKNAKDELDRVRQLLDEGGISQSDYDALELSYRVAKSSYDNLLENTILRSPVTGVVTARNYDKGDMYSMSQPLYTVQQIVPVKLLVGISESAYTRVKKGGKVTITADALPGREYTGTIARIYPTMDAATHTFNVEVQVRNENRELRPGMYAKAKVTFGSASRIVVPDIAVQKMQGAGTRQVFVLGEDGSTVAARVVSVGRHINGSYEILEGLEEGEMIVVKGASTLKSGDKVEVK